MRQAHTAFQTQQLFTGEIADIRTHAAGFQSSGQIAVAHQLAPSKVQNANSVLHLADQAGVNHAFGIRGGRNVQSDEIALTDQIRQIHAVLDAAGQIPGRFNGNVGIVTQHFHSQMGGHVGHLDTDGTQTDDAQLFAGQFRPHELFFAFFHQLGHVRLTGQRPRPGNALRHLAAAEYQTTQNQFLDGIGVGAGRIEHHNTTLTAFCHRNVVGARAGAGDGQKLCGQLHGMHIGAAH